VLERWYDLIGVEIIEACRDLDGIEDVGRWFGCIIDSQVHI